MADEWKWKVQKRNTLQAWTISVYDDMVLFRLHFKWLFSQCDVMLFIVET